MKFIENASPAELDWIRAQYYGNVTMVDARLGKLWDKLDALNLWETTAVIVTTDHGHDLCYNYPHNPTMWAKDFPHPESHARIPLMIWHPDNPGNGRRIHALTNTLDINATIRDLLDVPEADGPHGRSLLPLLQGETASHRDYLLYGRFGAGAVISTAEWTLTQSSIENGPLYWYSTTGMRASADMTSGHYVPGVEIPQWRIPADVHVSPNYLWNRSEFSLTPENHYAHEPQRVNQMQDLLRQALDDCAAPPETLERLGLA
jgi:arylsulfatase A-like enzyme